MLSSAQNTDICIRFDVCCSASGYVYGTHCSTCAPISTTLSAEHVVKSVFWAEWENSPPEVSAISSAYVYQWLMTAPLHWQRRQQQKHQKDRQKKRGGGRSERKGGNKKQHTVQASWSCGWLHWRIWGRGVERRVRVSENKRKRQKERERSERQSRVQPGLEARLCLCLGLIDFPENCCSRPLPSSLMKPSGIYHPTARPTPALHWLACPFIFFDSLLRRHTLTSTHTQSQTNVCMHTQAQREITCPTQATNKGSAKRMCRVVAFVYAHCLGFCLVAFLLYPRTKRRKN